MATKPYIFMAAMPIFGHVEKLKIIAGELLKRGYKITFFSHPLFKNALVSLGDGLEFVPFEGELGLRQYETDIKTDEKFKTLVPGIDRMMYEHETWFLGPAPSWYQTIQNRMQEFRKQDATTPLIFFQETGFFAMLLYRYGVPGVPLAGIVSVGTTPIAMRSRDTMPFGPGLPPDSSPEGRARNEAANKGMEMIPSVAQLMTNLNIMAKGMGATETIPLHFDAAYTVDRFLQLSIPEIEYPRSDLPKGFSYVGAIQGVGLGNKELPSWWGEILAHKKPVVVVSSGTISTDANDLIVPTIKALADKDDILVVATLVKADNLPEDFTIPANTRVASFIPFDELFKHVDIVVNNGGYGTVQLALSCGLPLVLAGMTEDKCETNPRTAWSGAAINLNTQRAEPAAVRAAVEEMLTNDKYTKRAQELKQRYKEMDAMKSIIQAMDELTEEWVKKNGN